MQQLIKDYKRRLAIAEVDIICTIYGSGYRLELLTKIECYRTFIDELEKVEADNKTVLQKTFDDLLYNSYEVIDGALRKNVINVNALKNAFIVRFEITQKESF